MKSKGRKIAALLLAVCLIIGGALCVYAEDTHAVGDSFLGGISAYKLSASSSPSAQGWLDGELTAAALPDLRIKLRDLSNGKIVLPE